MSDWEFAQRDTSEQLAQIHHFSVTKNEGTRQIEFVITVREYVTPKEPAMKFLATTDKQTNQKTMPFSPCGWGNTMLKALAESSSRLNASPTKEIR
jgi:hypothetical protein